MNLESKLDMGFDKLKKYLGMGLVGATLATTQPNIEVNNSDNDGISSAKNHIEMSFGGSKAYSTDLPQEALKIFDDSGSKAISLAARLIANGDRTDRVTGIMYPEYKRYNIGLQENFDNIKANKEDMNKIQYWVLEKIKTRNIDSEFLKGGLGIIPPNHDKNPALWHAVRAMTNLAPQEREADLLKSLYIYATGNENGALPLLNGSFMELEEVQNRIPKYKKLFPERTKEELGETAYLIITLKNTSFQSPNDVAIVLNLISNFYYNSNREKYDIYGGTLTFNLEKTNQIKNYRTTNNSPVIDINF